MIANSELSKLLSKISLYDDAIAYKELFVLYHTKLVQFSSSITQSKESAEEVVSDVFLKIWKNRSVLPTIENFNLYIYIITKNLSINYLHKQKRHQPFSLDNVVVEFRSAYLDPEELMITGEMHKRLHQAISELPPKCQLIFKLVKEDGLKYREVAELLHLSIKTIENQMTIALRRVGQSIHFKLTNTSLN